MTKEVLMHTSFTVDALKTCFSFPMFVFKGPVWALSALLSTEEKKQNEAILEDVHRLSFQKLWDLFMVCYEGYFGFTVSTLVCIYNAPETIPYFGYSLFGLYIYRLKYLANKV